MSKINKGLHSIRKFSRFQIGTIGNVCVTIAREKIKMKFNCSKTVFCYSSVNSTRVNYLTYIIPFASLFNACLHLQVGLYLTNGALSADGAAWLFEKILICRPVPPSSNDFCKHAKVAATSAWNTVANLSGGMLILCTSLLPYSTAPVPPPFQPLVYHTLSPGSKLPVPFI